MNSNLSEITNKLSVSSELVNLLSFAMRVSTEEQLEQLMLLVKMRRVATSEYNYLACADYDFQLKNKCEIIISASFK